MVTKQESLDVFEMMGVEPDFIQGSGIEHNDDYVQVKIKDAYEDEYYAGKPQLSNIITTSFEKRDEYGEPVYKLDKNGETLFDENDEPVVEKETNYRVDFVITDDDRMEELIIGLNLKSDDPVQKDVYSSSKLFELIKGIAEMKVAGSMANFNHFAKVNLDLIRKQLEEIPIMRVKIVEKTFGGNFYNSFVVVDPEL